MKKASEKATMNVSLRIKTNPFQYKDRSQTRAKVTRDVGNRRNTGTDQMYVFIHPDQ